MAARGSETGDAREHADDRDAHPHRRVAEVVANLQA
jgi:hypothetical protein